MIDEQNVSKYFGVIEERGGSIIADYKKLLEMEGMDMSSFKNLIVGPKAERGALKKTMKKVHGPSAATLSGLKFDERTGNSGQENHRRGKHAKHAKHMDHPTVVLTKDEIRKELLDTGGASLTENLQSGGLGKQHRNAKKNNSKLRKRK